MNLLDLFHRVLAGAFIGAVLTAIVIYAMRLGGEMVTIMMIGGGMFGAPVGAVVYPVLLYYLEKKKN